MIIPLCQSTWLFQLYNSACVVCWIDGEWLLKCSHWAFYGCNYFFSGILISFLPRLKVHQKRLDWRKMWRWPASFIFYFLCYSVMANWNMNTRNKGKYPCQGAGICKQKDPTIVTLDIRIFCHFPFPLLSGLPSEVVGKQWHFPQCSQMPEALMRECFLEVLKAQHCLLDWWLLRRRCLCAWWSSCLYNEIYKLMSFEHPSSSGFITNI